jgi:hypothetical protein
VNNLKDLWSYYSKTIITILLVVLTLGGLIYFGYNYYKNAETRLQEAITLTQEQALDIATLKQKLSLSQQNAEALQEQIQKVIAGKVKPVATFTQNADTVEDAAVDVQERINSGDTTLPAEALEKTDRTAVVPQKLDTKTDWEVGVYKINLRKKWEFGTGIGVQDSNGYIVAAVKNNYKKDRAVSVEAHLDPSDGLKPNGGQITYWLSF